MRKFKKISICLLLIFLMTSSMFGIYANSKNDIGLKLNGMELRTDVKPTIIEGRTLVPVRVISESLGATVRWNNQTKEVDMIYNTVDGTNTYIILPIGGKQAKIYKSNSQYTKKLDVPAQIINGRTLVPVRFVAEELGLNVNWNQEMKTVELNKKEEPYYGEKEEPYYGKLYYSDNSLKYKGQIKNNVPNGKGTYYYKNGDVYTGDFLNNKKNGYGEIECKTGDTYIGDFENDQKNGEGKYSWSNGESYDGEWKYDIMEGQGTYRFKNGDKYTGEWSNNCMDGKGTYTFKGGKSISGTWKNNKYKY